MNPEHARMREVALECATRPGVYVLDAAVHPHKRAVHVDVTVDTDEGITLDACAAISRGIAEALEREFPDVSFELQVGSPGIDTPLVHEWQFRKNVGRRLRLTVEDPDAVRTYELRLTGVEPGALVCEGGSGAVRSDRARLKRAVVLPEFKKQ